MAGGSATLLLGGGPRAEAIPAATARAAHTPVITAAPDRQSSLALPHVLRPAYHVPRLPQPAPRTFALIVTGAAGEPAYAERFEEVGATIVDALRRSVPAAQVTWLAETPQRDPGRIAGRSAKADVDRALDRLAAQAGAGDQVLVVLVGHGSHEGPESRVNLPGPDLTAAQLGRKLDAIRGARVAVVNAASASGDFVGALAKPGRVVVTATKTAFERNETRFAEHFAHALAQDVADTDKDGRVSLLEAFTYARAEVVRAYERDRRLLTEHAVLDGDGDGTGVGDATGQDGDGRLARAFILGGTSAVAAGAGGASAAPAAGAARPAGGVASTDPRVAALAAEKAALEQQVADLRGRKPGMEPAAYERELERLLVALAERTQALRAAEARKP